MHKIKQFSKIIQPILQNYYKRKFHFEVHFSLQIVSYPHFQVKITKPSGRTLHFDALYNKLSEEEGEGDNDPEEQFDLIRFDSLKMYNNSQETASAYEAETENMDGVRESHMFCIINPLIANVEYTLHNSSGSASYRKNNFWMFLKEEKICYTMV